MPKKVLHIIVGLAEGGAESSLYNVCKGSKGVDHFVISMIRGGVYQEKLKEVGVEVYSLDMRRGFFSFFSFLKLIKLIRKINPEVIHGWMYHACLMGTLASLLTRKSKIFWGIHHTSLDRKGNKATTIWVAKMLAYLSRISPKKIIYCANSAAETHERFGFHEGKSVVIPNGYNLDEMAPSDGADSCFPSQIYADGNAFILGMVARYHPLKGHDVLFDALEIVKNKGYNFSCVLIGNGLTNSNREVIEKIERRGLVDHVRLLGVRRNINFYMEMMDIHVLPSISEAFPNVIPEAMACGTPSIASNVGDISIIQEKTGWLFKSGDHIELSECIIDAMEEKENDRHGWQNRKSICRYRIKNNFSIEKTCSAYEEVWFGL